MEEIGRRLQAAREALGITLDTAEEEIKIRRKYLEGLELGRQADLPGEAYLKGFLRTYGNYLGLDGTALVAEYKQIQPHLPVPINATLVEPAASQTPLPVATVPVQDQPRARPERARRMQPTGQIQARRLFVGLVVLVSILLIGMVAWALAGYVGNHAPQAPTVGATPPPPVQTIPAPPDKVPVPEPVKVVMEKGTGDEVFFRVTAKELQVQVEPCTCKLWMQAIVDGQIKFDGFPTSPLSYQGTKIRLHMGHMDDVSLIVNGQRFDKPLKSGPFWLTFTLQ
jgi:transcriptional regulator with XRE-family HTH domain